MGKKPVGLKRGRFGLLWCMAVLVSAMFLAKALLVEQDRVDKPSKAEVVEHIKKLQIPFIANNGQVDKQVKFYANTFGGTVFVTKEGEIVYSLPMVAHASPLVHYDIDKNETGYTGLTGYKGKEGTCIVHRTLCTMYPYCTWNFPVHYSETNSPLCNTESNFPVCHSERSEESYLNNSQSEIPNPKSEFYQHNTPASYFPNLQSKIVNNKLAGIALREQFVGAKVNEIQGEDPSVTKVNYFKGNNPSKWKTNISTYDVVNLGEIYKGIDLKLKAYGNNVEKLFCVKSGASPDQIKIKLSGIQPPESPFIKGDSINNSSYKGGAAAKSPLEKGARGLWVNDEGQLVAETELGAVKFTKPMAYQEIKGRRVGVSVEYRIQKTELNPNSAIQNLSPTSIGDPKLEYGFKVASYDKSHDLIIDPLLASTYLGGSNGDYGYSLTLDTSGNVYVTGWTASSDFPTTSGAYDTSNNGSYDVFVSKLDGGLTSLLASTYLGGSDSDYSDYGYSLALDTSGNVYVTGYTDSTDFPTTSGAYDTSYNGSDGASYRGDVFVSKLNSELTSLLASTYLGGSGSEIGYSLTLDTSGNVYVTGETSSSDFPITSGTYDTSCSNCGSYDSDVFVSKLNSELTGLLASTYLGGTSYDRGYSLFLDTNGNVYVTGYTSSTDFPTTSGAYDTSFNGGSYDVFVLKLDGGLTTLLASTYLGGSGSYDYGYSLSLDTNGNVYVTGYTESTDFPTTSGAYDTSFNGGSYDVFVSKLDGGLTTLLSSTYLGGAGYGYDYSYSLVLDTNGNVYVAGKAGSGFPTTSGAYDTSYNGSDVFVSKLDSNLSSSKPTVSTGSATNVTSISATFNGTVNANGVSTTVWFQHGTVSGSYSNTSSSQVVSGSSNTTVSISISGLSSNTTYYYRIVALNSGGTSYGSEVSFNTSSAPTPAPTPTPTDTTAPSGLVSINSSASYTNSTTITLSLSATDNVGVVGYYVSTSSSTPTASASGWNSVTSTTSYSGSDSYTLTSGDETKTVYVWYKDDAGNVSIAASDSIILDTTAPIVTITSPTSTDTYTTTSNPLSLSGSASDGSSGVKEVTWNNDKGGSGTTSGTSYWSASSINLTSGENKITVTAKDNAGNTSTDAITIAYNAGKVPTAITGSATNVTVTAATLTGTVNANGASTTVWFQYGTVSGSYGNTSSSQVVSGSSNTTVSISISSLSSNMTYYYRIVASNSAGTSYGSEASFATKTVSTTPIPTTSPAPTLSPVPTPQVSPTPKPTFTPVASPSPAPTLPPLPTPIPTLTTEPNKKGTISGYIINKKGYPIESAKIRLKKANSKVFKKTFSNADGFFEFEDLDADTYIITAIKKGYKTVKQTITLEEGEEVDIEIVMKKKANKRRIKMIDH